MTPGRRREGCRVPLPWVADAPAFGFDRPGGWRVVTNFRPDPVPMPAGDVLVASGPLAEASDSTGARELPGETTVWLRVAPSVD